MRKTPYILLILVVSFSWLILATLALMSNEDIALRAGSCACFKVYRVAPEARVGCFSALLISSALLVVPKKTKKRALGAILLYLVALAGSLLSSFALVMKDNGALFYVQQKLLIFTIDEIWQADEYHNLVLKKRTLFTYVVDTGSEQKYIISAPAPFNIDPKFTKQPAFENLDE